MCTQVTVVIPTHNSESTIAAALQSVFNQDPALLSAVVVVDDASRDRTVELVHGAFRKAPPNCEVKILTNDVNLGGGATRNRGIECASTEIVALLDADDEWTGNHLSASVVALLEKQLDFVFGSPEQFSKEPKYKLGTSPLEFIFVEGGIAQTSSFVFRSRPRLRFDEKLLKHQDFDFIMNAFNQGLAIGQLDEATTKYHDSRTVRSRVSKQRRPSSSRLFLLKWRQRMSADARLCFLTRFHFYNRASIDLRTAGWALTRVARSKIRPSFKLRLVNSILKALAPR